MLFLTLFIPLISVFGVHAANSTFVCCKALEALLFLQRQSDQLSYPQDSRFSAARFSHWSSVAYGNPTCIYTPSSSASTADIARVVKLLTATDCEFRVRGGGHMPIPDFTSPSNGGILISMKQRKTLEVSDGKIKAGAGSLWGEVYDRLAPSGLTAVGGRVASVGIAGSTLGGGISHLGPRYGLMSDNVLEYEIILPNGTVVNPSARYQQELFWALKGGSSNFGLVTSFTYKTYHHPQVWGGMIVYTPDKINEFTNAVTALQLENPSDPISILPIYVMEAGVTVLQITLFHPDPTDAPPPSVQVFLNIPNIVSTVRKMTVAQAARETDGGADGQQRFFYGGAVKAHRYAASTLVTALQEVVYKSKFVNIPAPPIDFNSEAALQPGSLLPFPPLSVPGSQIYLSIQHISTDMLNKGDHSFGLDPDPSSRPYLMYLVVAAVPTNSTIPNIHKDLTQVMADFHREAQATARKYNINHGFVYLNEAGFDYNNSGSGIELQPAFDSWSSSKLRRLNAVLSAVDPRGDWRRLTGGFKIPRRT